MSSLMMKAAMVLVASLLSGGKPSAAKNRADAARSLTGRLTAILVDIGASVFRGRWLLLVDERREWKCGRRCLHVVPLAFAESVRCVGRRAAASWRPDPCVTGALGGAGLDPAGSRIGYGTVPGGPGNASVM